jgi:hypothetical protein
VIEAGSRLGQPLDSAGGNEIDDEAQRRGRDARTGQDADAADLDAPGDRGRRPGHDVVAAAGQLGLVIGDEARAGIDQAQRQVRLPASRPATQQHPLAIDSDAGAVGPSHGHFYLRSAL